MVHQNFQRCITYVQIICIHSLHTLPLYQSSERKHTKIINYTKFKYTNKIESKKKQTKMQYFCAVCCTCKAKKTTTVTALTNAELTPLLFAHTFLHSFSIPVIIHEIWRKGERNNKKINPKNWTKKSTVSFNQTHTHAFTYIQTQRARFRSQIITIINRNIIAHTQLSSSSSVKWDACTHVLMCSRWCFAWIEPVSRYFAFLYDMLVLHIAVT